MYGPLCPRTLARRVPSSAAPLTGGVVPHTIEVLGAGPSHQLPHRTPGPACADQVHRGVALGTCKDQVHTVSRGVRATMGHFQAVERSGFVWRVGAAASADGSPQAQPPENPRGRHQMGAVKRLARAA